MPAGGDGTGKRIEATSGESAETGGFARCGGDEDRTGAFRASARPPFSPRRKGGKTRPGTSSEHTSLTPFPQNRNTAKTPYRSVVPPLQIETVRFDLRRTFRRNLPAATNGSCAVFRRIRTRLRPIGSPAGFYGGRGTKDAGVNRKSTGKSTGTVLADFLPTVPKKNGVVQNRPL